MKKFKFYADAGHAWLAVRTADIEAVGLKVTGFSHYSYCKGDTFYLEEDCDAGIFIEQWKQVHGAFVYTLVDHGNRSRIRSFDRVLPF